MRDVALPNLGRNIVLHNLCMQVDRGNDCLMTTGTHLAKTGIHLRGNAECATHCPIANICSSMPDGLCMLDGAVALAH